MDPALGFTDGKTGREIGFVYGKLRRAELQDNAWRFSIREATIRPIDTTTMLLAPALWVATTTYFIGSVVSDSSGTIWVSQQRNNLGNQPSLSSAWAEYFGPMTVDLWNATGISPGNAAYSAGELVYTAAGDGTNNVYMSLQSDNALHPALPNQWAIGTTYFMNQVVQVFPAWAVGTTYTKGQGITYTDGNVYASLTNSNVGNIPSSSATNWALMPVLSLASPLPSTGSTTPITSPVLEWQSGTTYGIGSFVMFNGSEYLSLVANNTANYPNAAASTSWIIVTNGTLYMSLLDLNIGNAPATSPLAWTTSFTQGGGNQYWMQIGGASFPNGVGLTILGSNLFYPLGSGPASQTFSRNVFRLPAAFLREAPQDPKAGISSFLGAPGNLYSNDWLYEGNYIVSMCATPIRLRFIADVADVTTMDDMFCEGLAARIGIEVCEPLTQSTEKIRTIGQAYDRFMGKAKLSNAILLGAKEPPLDDWIACRA
jgi:hypothetical protein